MESRCVYEGGSGRLNSVEFKVRNYAAAEELARRMCLQMQCKIYHSEPDRPQDGWFVVSTQPFNEN